MEEMKMNEINRIFVTIPLFESLIERNVYFVSFPHKYSSHLKKENSTQEYFS